MKKILLITVFAAVLPALATAEKKMQNSDPSPKAVEEPTLGHHMQNRNPNPETAVEVPPKPEHTMRNSNPSPEAAPEHTMRNTNPKE